VKTFLGCAALALAIGLMSAPADAKGCLKGAAVGGVAGHVAGHHGFVGAAAGCAISRSDEERKERCQAATPGMVTHGEFDFFFCEDSFPIGLRPPKRDTRILSAGMTSRR